jgi:hypothetical protein
MLARFTRALQAAAQVCVKRATAFLYGLSIEEQREATTDSRGCVNRTAGTAEQMKGEAAGKDLRAGNVPETLFRNQ